MLRTDEMIERVKGWITDKGRTTAGSIEVAENIRDLCEEWLAALQGDLEDE